MEVQIAGIIFLASLSSMKKTLDLLEFKLGKDSSEFKYMKKNIMDNTYRSLQKLFKQLTEAKMIKKCLCGTSLRTGFKKCDCKGSGYINLEN